MSPEDRAFLEKVMKEGIIDENERMKFILGEATRAMEQYRRNSKRDDNADDKADADAEEKTPDQMDGSDRKPPTEDELVDLLQELRDIVEQIDYARAFCSLQGLPFLLGCALAKDDVPHPIRSACLGIVSTLAQNNPPVQQQLLEMGAIKTVSDVFFADEPSSLRPRCIQAISSIVRNHELAEGVFEKLEQAPELMLSGIKGTDVAQLPNRTLFFLRAFLTSDTTSPERIETFSESILQVIDRYILHLGEDGFLASSDLYEQSLSFVQQLLATGKDTVVAQNRQKQLAAEGVEKVIELGKQLKDSSPGSMEHDTAHAQLNLWQSLLTSIS